MPLNSEWGLVIVPLLVFLVSASFYCSKYYHDKSGKFEDKDQLEELNELRIQIRNTETLPVIDKLWEYLDHVYDEKTGYLGDSNPINIKATDIAYDHEHRHNLNTLLNELTRIIEKDLDVKGVWNKLMEGYRKISINIFILAGVSGSGFVIPILNLLHIDESISSYIPYLWLVQFAVGVTILSRTISLIQKTKSDQRSYSEKRKKYLTEDIRIR